MWINKASCQIYALVMMLSHVYATRNLLPLHFKYENFDFNEKNATVAWNPARDCDDNVTYRLVKTLQRNNETFLTQETSYNISSDFLEENPERYHKFLVEALCNGTLYMRSMASLIIPREVHTIKTHVDPATQEACLSYGSFIAGVVWPKSNSSINGSCICPSWFRISQCECISKDNFYGVENTKDESNEYHICWKNIQHNMKVHFVQQTPNLVDPKHPFPRYNLLFLTSYRFVVDDVSRLSLFSFKYEKISFSDEFATIAWNSVKHCDGNVSYNVTLTSYGQAIMYFNTEETSFNISNTYLDDNPSSQIIYVKAYCNDIQITQTDSSLTILRDVQTVNIPVNQSLSKCLQPVTTAVSVIWAKSDISDDGSCLCKNWQHIHKCSCISEENFYNVTNEHSWANHKEICWRNIVNNTKVYFVIETPNSMYSMTSWPYYNLHFVMSFNFILAGKPNPPTVVNAKDSYFCFSDEYDGNSPIREYIVKVQDTTGYTMTTSVNKVNVSTCLDVAKSNNYSFKDCSPLNITVFSRNEIGISEASSYKDDGGGTNEPCLCFWNNVNVTLEMVNISTSKVVIMKLSCNNIYDNSSNITISVEFSTKEQQYTASCYELLMFESLLPSTRYNYNLTWTTTSSTICSREFSFTTKSKARKIISTIFMTLPFVTISILH